MPADKCLVTNSQIFRWSNDTPFNGYCLVLMSFPHANSGVSWSYAVVNDSPMRLRVPSAVKLPIRDGYFESDAALIRTDKLSPPLCQWAAFYYDNTDRLIAIEGNRFNSSAASIDLSTNPFTITTIGFPASYPYPQEVPNNYPEIDVIPVDGTTTVFTLSRSGSSYVVMENDSPMVTPADYTISQPGAGQAQITFVVAPGINDRVVVYIW